MSNRQKIVIDGEGPVALAKIFKLLSSWITEAGGINNFLHGSFYEFYDVSTDDPEVAIVLLLIAQLIDSTIDVNGMIQDLYDKVNCSWMARSYQLFTPCFMGNFPGSRYFEILAEKDNPPPKEILKAWLTDLQNGLYPASHDIVVSYFEDFVYHPANEKEYIEGFKKLLEDNDLVEMFRSVPHAMLVTAQLENVRV